MPQGNINEEIETCVAGSPEATSTVETPQETVTPATVTETPADDQNNTAKPVIEPANGSGNQPKKDGPWGKTELEQAQYSFHKQLRKQREKYENQINGLVSRLEKLEHPEKYRPKTRSDFPLEKGGDDQYINYLVDEKVKALFSSQLEAWKKEQEEEEARKAVDEEYRARADENIKKLYPTPEAEKNFRDTVREAMDRGLGELLDQDESLSNYILMSPVGPSIMYKLASSKEAVAKLFEGARTPMDLQFRIRDLEREVNEEIKAKAVQTPPAAIEQPQQTAAPQKVVGRPGLNKDVKKSVWDDDKSLLDQMRSM